MTAQPLPKAFSDAETFAPPEAPPEAPLSMPLQVLERRSGPRDGLRRLLAGPRRASAE